MAEQFDLVEALRKLGEFIGDRAAAFSKTLDRNCLGLMTSAGSIVNIAMLFIIAPIVAVYLLLDWDNMIARISDLIHAIMPLWCAVLQVKLMQPVCICARNGRRVFNPWVYYAVALMAVGLNFGLSLAWLRVWSHSFLMWVLWLVE